MVSTGSTSCLIRLLGLDIDTIMRRLQAVAGPPLGESTAVVHELGVGGGSDVVPRGGVSLAVPDNVGVTHQSGNVPSSTTTGDAYDGVDRDSLNGVPGLPSGVQILFIYLNKIFSVYSFFL